MNIEKYFKFSKGITVGAAFKCGMKYTAIDLCRFAKKYSERNDKQHAEMHEALKDVHTDITIVGEVSHATLDKIKSLLKELKYQVC